MSPAGIAAGGFAGILFLTTALRAASEAGLTRMDLPFLLGTTLTANRTRAKALGYLLHFVNGQAFAFVYFAIFFAIHRAGWWLGAVFGLAYGVFAATALGQRPAAPRAPPNGLTAHHRTRRRPPGVAGLPDARLRHRHAAVHPRRPRRLRRRSAAWPHSPADVVEMAEVGTVVGG